MSTPQRGGDQLPPPQQQENMQTRTPGNLGDPIFDSEVVPSLLEEEIAPILRLANEFESIAARVAYLCRCYAFEKAQELDPTSSGRGVDQFKTALHRRLEKENEPTLRGRVEKSDGCEMQSFCQHYYKGYIQPLQNAPDKADRAQLANAEQTSNVLLEVLKSVSRMEPIQIDRKILEAQDEVEEVQDELEEETQIYVPYNILPLDPDGANQEIMKYPEIQAAVVALRNTRGLPWPKDHKKKKDEDILDWLQAMFGFQKDNVANQREHLILLIANVHIRMFPQPNQPPQDGIPVNPLVEWACLSTLHFMDLFLDHCHEGTPPELLWASLSPVTLASILLFLDNEQAFLIRLHDQALTEVMKKLFENYEEWCKFLDRKSRLWSVRPGPREQQLKLLHMGLYLLIWGEAANLRFMPECLCYIYHHMAFDLFVMLRDKTGQYVRAIYVGEEAFLRKVVTPIYEVIAKEAIKSNRGRSAHSQWRNYDDLNEYFWSVDCFQLGWPMRADADFFHVPAEDSNTANRDRWVGKVNFVEIRSFWQIFRSYDRMWSFFILCLQVRFLAVLDVILTWKAQRSMSDFVKLRYILKVVSAATWVIILTVTYAHTWENHPGSTQTIKNWFGNGSKSPSLFILAVVIYLSPNMLAALLFLFPSILQMLERSRYKIVMLMMWWSQPRLYIARGMRESTFSLFKYTSFWVLLLTTKLAFSYYVEIKPLVGPTKAIMSVQLTNLQWQESFPRAKNNIDVLIAIWAPVILVYFMDTQIWYAIFSTFCGGIYGAFRRLGEIQTLRMLRSRFQSLRGAFKACLIPEEVAELERLWAFFAQSSMRASNGCLIAEEKFEPKTVTFSQSHVRTPSNEEKDEARFALLWNAIISSFREEDLISNREMNLLLVPYSTDRELEDIIQWPPFLLAGKILEALDLAIDSNSTDWELREKIETDNYMSCAIHECHVQFRKIIRFLVQGEREKQIIELIFSEVDKHLEDGNLIREFQMTALPILYSLIVKLLKLLLANAPEDRDAVARLFREMLEIVTRDMMKEKIIFGLVDSISGGSEHEGITPLEPPYQLFASVGAIRFPIEPATEVWKEIKRLDLLFTTKESAVDVPSNLEARRRISFFSNSLFMEMPAAPHVRNMLSFSVLTPHYMEEVLFMVLDLKAPNVDKVSILSCLQKIFPDEWTNFLERVKCESEDYLEESDELIEPLRLWASYRGQTLTRTVRGMMYYRKALELQAFLDLAKKEDLIVDHNAVELNPEEHSRGDGSVWAQCQAVADMKFTYVVSCQQYGTHKRSEDPRAQDILKLMIAYPSVRVAYIDEVEEPNRDGQKTYYSTLVKAALPKSIDSSEPVQNLDEVIYRIKLPGPAILGEGKPENQNHAIIFTRGEGLQTIDMNQDNYMEEALKMRNLLQEFLRKHDGMRYPTILGLREHIFTGSVSSLAWFMSNQETTFVTIGQRLLANPLKVRFHYGHPDVFDRLFHLTRGGVSKASKGINLSEDIFAGFNSTLREGNVTHHEYIQVGKGRDVGLNQISMFEAKIANGNGEQTLSRDIYRLGHHFDFFRMLSCYFTTVGFYFSTLITVLTIYVFLYGRLYLVFSGLEKELSTQPGIADNKPLQVAIASQSFVQIGFFTALPMLIEIGLERGFGTAFSDFLLMQLQLAPVFFTFSLGTKTHHYGSTLLHGGAKYRGTGRGFVVFHAKFADNYRMYSRSHFVKGFEITILLLVYHILGSSYRGVGAYELITIFMWFMVGTWLFAPFLFNPSGFEWQKIVDDWRDWNKWISKPGEIGLPQEYSWESWWEEEQEHLRHSGKRGIIAEIILALRFFIYQYGLVYHLNITKHNKSVLVYGISWLVILLILSIMKAVSVGQRKLGVESRRVFWVIKILIFLLLAILVIFKMKMRDTMICILAFMPTGWGMLLIAQACKPLVVKLGIWGSIQTLARGYEIIMGFLLFTPVAFLAFFPFVSEVQTCMLFNQAFSRGLQISHILGRQRKDEDQSSNNRE